MTAGEHVFELTADSRIDRMSELLFLRPHSTVRSSSRSLHEEDGDEIDAEQSWCLSASDEAEAVQWERAIEDAIEVQDTERYIQRFHTSARNLHALSKVGGAPNSSPA